MHAILWTLTIMLFGLIARAPKGDAEREFSRDVRDHVSNADASMESRYEVVLEQFGEDKRLDVVKVIRGASGKGLADIVALLKKLPSTVHTCASLDEANKLKKELELIESKVRPVRVSVREKK